jgi:hypothetical protein
MRLAKNKLNLVFLFMITAIYLYIPNVLLKAQENADVDVRLLVNSGLPNPGWVFDSPDDIIRLQEFIKDLPEADPVIEPLRSVVFLLSSNDPSSQFPETVFVFDGVVKIRMPDGSIRFFQDTKGFLDFLVEETFRRGIIGTGTSETGTSTEK